MTDEAIINLINKALSEKFHLDPETLTPDALLREDLGIDSLDAVDMVILLEETFKNSYNKEIPQEIKHLNDLHSYIIKLYNEEKAQRNITKIFEQITEDPNTQ
ncbi:phosphopantetheine-binding protein [Desulfovibrio litoralis]|uniref:Acyl carrier protein n=1 Tax=Desulfovibrio litoralis DSM 11393 TaxID=1121455 RepID=A0A1M7TA56_9BACT|nr:phosphopantetheine-binding protein [Desulfovibrio litoralis]SHN67576.1 acyl carrier protein [Desulfovibrio litoralis DSM 11393]